MKHCIVIALVIVVLTACAAPTPKPVPTIRPTDRPTALPGTDMEYANELDSISLRFADSLNRYPQLIQQAINRPSLMHDVEWKREMNVLIASMRANADEYRRLSPPSRFVDVDPIIDDMADAITRMADNIQIIVDTGSFDRLAEANQDMYTITALAQQATAKMTRK